MLSEIWHLNHFLKNRFTVVYTLLKDWKRIMRNYGEKKSQENSQCLLDSQENVFRKLSEVFSQSSHSTNIGDFEEALMQTMDVIHPAKEMDLEESHPPSTYNLRDRTRIKRPNTELQTRACSNSKHQKLSKRNIKDGKHSQAMLSVNTSEVFPPADDLENSQESVSMLQECYQNSSKNDFPNLMETCMNSELEAIDIYSDEEIEVPVDDELTTVKVENSTQTEILVSQPILYHPKQKTISDKKLWMILHGVASDSEESPLDMEIDKPQLRHTLPKETIGYLFRSSDVENVFRETVQLLLQHLEDVLGENFAKIACCWKNSVYEIVVAMLSEAVDSEAGVWKMVASFLGRIIDSILNDESKNWILESKANLIIDFCRSTRLSYSVVNCITKKLQKVNTIQRPSGTADRLSSLYLTNNLYFLLRILESSLKILKCKVSEEAIEGALIKKPQGQSYNVLEMWKKHWNRNESTDEQKTGHEWEATVSGWCNLLDAVLLHCVNHVPVLSMAVERCVQLAREILKLCHPWVTQGKV